MVKNYLSYGGGVNSTALLLWMIDEGIDFEAVFVDHGGDYPYTYDYVNYINKDVYPITILKPDVEGFSTIEEYSLHYKILPTIRHRWCTDKFKVRPQLKYFERPCINYHGISFEERHRAKQSRNKGIDLKYPLIEKQLGRNDCIDIIKEHSVIVPKRSGCFFCPMMKKKEFRSLFVNYPYLFERVLNMENNCANKNFAISITQKKLSYMCPIGTQKLEKTQPKEGE